MASRASSAALAIACAFSSAAASAEPAIERYGEQLLLSDAIAVAIGAIAVQRENDAAFVGAALVYGFAPTAIHLAHGNRSAATASSPMRFGFLTLGAWLGWAVEGGGDGVGTGAVVGAAIGGLTAIAIDAAFGARVRARAAITPTFSAGAGGVVVGVAGEL